MKCNILFCLLFAFSLFSCSADDEALLGSQAQSATRAANAQQTHYLMLEVEDDYKTFLISGADYCVVGDRDSFPFYTDSNYVNHIIADYSYIDIFPQSRVLRYTVDWLVSTVARYNELTKRMEYDYFYEGDKIAVWASKEVYSNEDLKKHEGDAAFYEKVSLSFTCCFITTFQKNLIIYCAGGRWWTYPPEPKQ